jgi:tryptophan synthase beta subunit
MLEQASRRYGEFGGSYIPEILVAPMQELEHAAKTIAATKEFQDELNEILHNYVGRPTPLTEVKHFSKAINGPRIFLKREDMLHTGAHKINNAIGQCLLAKKMGKTKIIAETGAGQHGVATATACAYLGMQCEIFMGEVDIERQMPNVQKMRLLGAKVTAVTSGSKTLKDAVNEALRQWTACASDTHYCLGSALGPYPFPQLVAAFHSVIGKEAREQVLKQAGELPHTVIACVGGGSNAIGIFQGFLEDKNVKLIGVEAGGHGDKTGEHAARFLSGKPGILHGCFTYVLQNDEGQIQETASISAGLDYPAIGPQHAYLKALERASYVAAKDDEALNAFKLLSRTEGIIPALESSHALAEIVRTAENYNKDDIVVINLSGRGDKDLPQLLKSNLV